MQVEIAAAIDRRGVVKRELLDLNQKEFASVASDIPPIIPRYDLYATRDDWLNQRWTEMIAG